MVEHFTRNEGVISSSLIFGFHYVLKGEVAGVRQLHGVKAPHYKNTTGGVPFRMPVPDTVVIPMAMHIGAPCDPVVKVGEPVKVGQPIGEPVSFVGAPVHASVSGTVKSLGKVQLFNGQSTAVTIEADKQQTVWEGVKPPEVKDTKSFLDAVRASGLVGLGGAGFPTGVKLSVKEGVKVDYLLVNGAECEPYLTSDHSTMLLDADDLIEGAELVRKYIGIPHIIIGIENNKPDAVALLKEKTKEKNDFQVRSLPATYPQGGEKVLVYNTTGRIVGEGQLPLDVGCIVMNVTSLAFLAKYMKTGMPLVEKCVTLDGSAVVHPCRVIAPIGTRIRDLVEAAGGYKGTPGKILMGGPMMGISAPNDDISIVKNTNGILAFSQKDAALPEETECINCGRCAAACPLRLMPNRIARAYKLNDVEALAALKVNLCMECGSCSYVCPAKRDLVLRNKLSKAMLMKQQKRGEKK